MLKILLPGLIVLIIIQWLVPMNMIWEKSSILNKGTAYKFKMAPIDPSNPFIGKYIILNFEEDHVLLPGKQLLNYRKKIFLKFAAGKDGFVKISSVDTTKPAGTDYLETTLNYASEEKDSTRVFINYPFKTFYMQEYKAPKAEEIYREESRDSSSKVYALVKVFNGNAVVKDVYVNDSLINDVINARKKSGK